MAEVKKKFSQLDPGSVPFEGTEILAAVQGGITKRGTISGIHGAGWWDKLKAAFIDFIAPDALHANDADTIGGETSAELHNAGALTGVAPLSVIPAELTGKNAATATYATNAGYATNAATATYATNAGYATTAGRTPNDYGASLPPPDETHHGGFFYRTEGTVSALVGLYYCARTASSTYQWIKIQP